MNPKLTVKEKAAVVDLAIDLAFLWAAIIAFALEGETAKTEEQANGT